MQGLLFEMDAIEQISQKNFFMKEKIGEENSKKKFFFQNRKNSEFFRNSPKK